MDREALRKYCEKIIIERNSEAAIGLKVNFFNQCWAANIIDQERVLKGCINHFYDIVFKENKCNTKNSIIDTAIHFEVSISTVKNSIYKFNNIRLNL